MAKKPEPPPLSSWHVYKVAAKKPVWLGRIEAPDAIQKAAQEFRTEGWRLYAVARRSQLILFSICSYLGA
jgi:hypothetical protein